MTQLSANDALTQVQRTLRRGDAVSALRMSSQIVKQAPQFFPGQALHAEVLMRVGRTATARLLLDRLIAAAPEEHHPPLHLSRARTLLLEGRAGDAVEPAERAHTGRPDDPEAVAAYAEALAGSGRAEDALKALDDAGGRGLDSITMSRARGETALAGAGDASAAAGGLADATGKVGAAAWELTAALRTLAELRARAGDDDEALTVFKRAAKIAAPGADPAPHAKGVDQLVASWTPETLAKLPHLSSAKDDREAGEGFVVVAGLPGGSADAARAVATAGGAHGVSQQYAFVGAVFGTWAAQPAGFSAWLAPPMKATTPHLTRIRDLTLNSARAASGGDETKPFIDAGWAQLYALGALPLILPKAKLVIVDRPLGDAALATLMTESAPQAPFAADPVNAAVTIKDMQRVLDHAWSLLSAEGVLGGALRVSYDALVGDDDAARTELLGFLGLESSGSALAEAKAAAASFTQATHRRAGLSSRFGGRLKDMHRALEPDAS